MNHMGRPNRQKASLISGLYTVPLAAMEAASTTVCGDCVTGSEAETKANYGRHCPGGFPTRPPSMAGLHQLTPAPIVHCLQVRGAHTARHCPGHNASKH